MPAMGHTPTSIIPNPVASPSVAVSREAAKCEIARELGLDSATRIIGLVGRLARWKRPDIFVAACAGLKKRVSNISLAFVIVGS